MTPGWGGLNGLQGLAAIAAANPGLMNSMAMDLGFDASSAGLGGMGGGLGGGVGSSGDPGGGYGFGIGPGPGGENSVGPEGQAGPY
jgi:hypothetical protein